MVFFTCNACGESLKKAQVDKHVNMCRGCQMLSCIDCGKDFWEEDYKNHIKCITEDQKYGGKGFEAKSNKGDLKQQQWIQRIHEAMNKQGVNAMLKDVLQQVSSFDNVPRKKAKFQNWMRNSLKILNPTLHAQVWDICSATTDNPPEVLKKTEEPKHPVSKNKADTNGSQPTYQNGAPEELAPDKKKLNKRERKEARQKKSGKIKKGQENDGSKDQQEEANKGKAKKRKRSSAEEGVEENGHTGEWTSPKKQKKTKDSCEDNQNTEVAEEPTEQSHSEAGSKGKFNWKGTIKAVLRQSPEEGLSVKKLRKKDQTEETLDLEVSLMSEVTRDTLPPSPTGTPSPHLEPSPRPTSSGRKASPEITPYQAQILSRLDQAQNKYTENEYYLLGLAPTLERLDPRKQAMAKLRFQQALFDIEFGE